MDQKPEQIERHIDRKRRDLRSNFEELEDKVKAVTDWRQLTRNNPAGMLAAAFGGGLLISNMLGRRRPRAALREATSLSRSAQPFREPRSWQNVKEALVGVAAGKFQQVLSEVVPGFREHLSGSEAGEVRGRRATQMNSVQGEGDYESARHYRRGVEEFVQHADIEEAARKAAPSNRREAAEMEAAERAGRSRGRGPF
jgi:hypothetical protein